MYSAGLLKHVSNRGIQQTRKPGSPSLIPLLPLSERPAMGTRLTPVAFDIETTGFETDATVTTVGLILPLGCRVFVNTDGRSIDTEHTEGELEAEFETTLSLSSHPTERGLLEAFADFVEESVSGNDYMLVAYNGELYRGGFDLPFLRTRYAHQDVQWPFDNVPYSDLLPIFRNRFNTTVDESSVNDLDGVYATLVGDGLTALDPFEESSQAVTAFEERDFRALLAHNLADILRTDALARLAQEYCGKAEFNLKSLTPTVRDPALSSGYE